MQEVYRKILLNLQSGRHQEAERQCLFELGSRQSPDARLLFYLGTAARMLNKPQAARVAFDAALEMEPDNPEFLQACASTCEANKNYAGALRLMQRAVELVPNDVQALANLAIALERAGRPLEALPLYQRVLTVAPDNRVANLNLGALLHKLGRKREALVQNQLAHARLPGLGGTLYNLADTLIANFRYQEALDLCEQGLTQQPNHAHLQIKQAIALSGLSRTQEALATLSRARIANPDVVRDLLPWTRSLPASTSVYMDGHVLEYEARYVEQQACFWQYRRGYLQKLRQDVAADLHRNIALAGMENGFRVLSLEIDAGQRLALMRHVAETVMETAWAQQPQPFIHAPRQREKIRIGYLSPDLREHAVSILARQVFGLHDRAAFEVYAYSLFSGDDRYRRQIEADCDVFRDVSKLDAWAMAQAIHDDEVDILVDLAGYTTFCRTEVMAMRPAPVQVLYLGFPCTMGADFIDYALIDRTICADGQQQEWHEQVIRLPHSLYPYDNETANAPATIARPDFGLPENGFVFCCLNNNYKIEPRIFGHWMNILRAVPDSVLWLLGRGLDVEDNLKREAEAHGIDRSRLVFTGRLPLEQHLPRYQLADLFLDTYWHNAHTTAAEALWQGLPLLTIHGEVASARGSAIILHALEMPELVTRDFDEYERLAVFYATHPAEYAAMREKLRAKRYTAPMYNTKLTVKHIERAYRMIWERHQAGLPPASFDVPEIDDPELRKSIH